jgi:hypothetical protein
VPVGDVFIGNPRGHIKHDDTRLALDIISITEATKLLLSGCVPYIETYGAIVGGERERMNFHTEGG